MAQRGTNGERLAKSMMIALGTYHLNNNFYLGGFPSFSCLYSPPVQKVPASTTTTVAGWMVVVVHRRAQGIEMGDGGTGKSHDPIQFASESMNVACSTQFSNSFSSGSEIYKHPRTDGLT